MIAALIVEISLIEILCIIPINRHLDPNRKLYSIHLQFEETEDSKVETELHQFRFPKFNKPCKSDKFAFVPIPQTKSKYSTRRIQPVIPILFMLVETSVAYRLQEILRNFSHSQSVLVKHLLLHCTMQLLRSNESQSLNQLSNPHHRTQNHKESAWLKNECTVPITVLKQLSI